MKKIELLDIYNKELKKKGMAYIDGINKGSTKQSIQKAIECLKCPDKDIEKGLKTMDDQFPNVAAEIRKTDYLIHPYNRIYIYTLSTEL